MKIFTGVLVPMLILVLFFGALKIQEENGSIVIKEEATKDSKTEGETLVSESEEVEEECVKEICQADKESVKEKENTKRDPEENIVLYAQEILKEEGYLPGPLDGIYGPKTRASLFAFQKVQGLGVTGEMNADTKEALGDPKKPEPKHVIKGTYLEVDIDKQLAYLVRSGEVKNILHVSTGRKGFTPHGTYEIYAKELKGWRNAINREGKVIGQLYNPIKFYGPYYVHGSDYIPLYPASAGCVRTMPHHTDHLHDLLEVGDKVIIY